MITFKCLLLLLSYLNYKDLEDGKYSVKQEDSPKERATSFTLSYNDSTLNKVLDEFPNSWKTHKVETIMEEYSQVCMLKGLLLSQQSIAVN